MSSPSRLRREGRNAFYRGGTPADHNPYSDGSFHRQHWFNGWEEAAKEDEVAIAAQEQADLDDYDKVQEFARLYNLAKEQGLIS
jgi:ribosome modulation factor